MTSGNPTVHDINNFYYLKYIFYDFLINLIQNRFILGFFILKNEPKYPNIRVHLGLWYGVMCFGGRGIVLGYRDVS